MMEFRLATPWLLAMLVLPLLVWLWRERRAGATFPGFTLATQILRPSRGPLLWLCLLGLGLSLLVVAIARPQYGRTITERAQEGRDLMLLIDLSGSMQIDDMTTEKGERSDRLGAVFNAARQFITKRSDDRIGLAFFSTTALTSCPLTYDHATALSFLDQTEARQRAMWAEGNERGLLGGSTNIGLGLGTSLRYLTSKQALGQALILITDGADTRNSPGWIDPIDASRRALGRGVKVYGIGVGNPHGTATLKDQLGGLHTVPLRGDMLPDMNRLDAIAKAGGGLSFPATDQAGLSQVFKRIDELEPTPHTETTREDYADRYQLALAGGLLLIALALALEPRLRGVA